MNAIIKTHIFAHNQRIKTAWIHGDFIAHKGDNTVIQAGNLGRLSNENELIHVVDVEILDLFHTQAPINSGEAMKQAVIAYTTGKDRKSIIARPESINTMGIKS